jgi:hypothetical protein
VLPIVMNIKISYRLNDKDDEEMLGVKTDDG